MGGEGCSPLQIQAGSRSEAGSFGSPGSATQSSLGMSTVFSRSAQCAAGAVDALPVQRYVNRTVHEDGKALRPVCTNAPVLLVSEVIAVR